MGPAAIIGGGLSIASGIIGSIGARKRAKAAAREKKRLQGKLNSLEANRQEIINPYEMQIEEADISLANTLDTLRATGASAGGATALAQAALKSKKGVSASIEVQEKQNEDKRAAGEKQKQDALLREGQRVQEGEAWEFNQREQREMQELDRTASLLGAAQAAEAQAQMDQTGAITGALGTLGGIAATPGLLKPQE